MKELIAIVIFFLFFGCDSGTTVSEHNESEVIAVEQNVSETVDNYLYNQEKNSPPSWEELEYLAQGLSRNVLDDMLWRINTKSDAIEQKEGYISSVIALWDSYLEQYGGNMSAIEVSVFAPVADSSGNAYDYPLDIQTYDIKMRNAALGYLHYKLKGESVMWHNTYPPYNNYGYYKFESEESFESYLQDSFLPNVAIAAKAAELVKAELFAPFVIELGVLIENQPFVKESGYSSDKKRTLAQHVVSEVIHRVRSLYHGKIVANQYYSYDAWGDVNPYLDINYSGYDIVAMTFIPKCDSDENSLYFNQQISDVLHTSEINGIDWMVGELWVTTNSLQSCLDRGEDIETIESRIYNDTINIFESTSKKPLGIFIDEAFQAESTKALIKALFTP